MENVLDYLCTNNLSAGVCDNYGEIPDACSEAWYWLNNDAAVPE
jgi:hypothetical protein